MIHRIYRYVVKHDTGVAPNVDGGICTLALCKPVIRRCAQVGDWVVGLWPAPDRTCITYVMRVGEIVPLSNYWRDRRFNWKKHPSPTPDNIYKPDDLRRLRRDARTWVHQKSTDRARDLGGRNVLVAETFWYFGGLRRELPVAFHCLDLAGSRRGHQVSKWGKQELEQFMAWLDGNGSGDLGAPRDKPPPRGGRCT